MKTTPYDMQLDAMTTITRTFTHYANPRFACSCGKTFNSEGPCPRAVEGEIHDVKELPPRKSFELTLKRLGNMESMSVQGYVDQKAIKYVFGVGEPGKPGYKKPDIMAPVGGKPVKMSPEVCLVAAILEQAQVAKPEERYTFEELASFMMSDSMCLQMVQASRDIQEQEDESPLA